MSGTELNIPQMNAATTLADDLVKIRREVATRQETAKEHRHAILFRRVEEAILAFLRFHATEWIDFSQRDVMLIISNAILWSEMWHNDAQAKAAAE